MGTLIEREINELAQRLYKLERSGRKRRFIAYLLKIIAGGSGLVVALDVLGSFNKWLGAAILIAVFLDAVFANYERLIGETRAGYAAKFKLTKIMADHNRALTPLLARMKANPSQSAEYQQATAAKDALEESTHQLLLAAVTEIEQALADLDLNALKSLSLEAERATTKPPQG